MESFLPIVRSWTHASVAERESLVDHVSQHDFPESFATYQEMALAAGFYSIRCIAQDSTSYGLTVVLQSVQTAGGQAVPQWKQAVLGRRASCPMLALSSGAGTNIFLSCYRQLSHSAAHYPLYWLQALLESELDALQRMRKTEPVRREIAALQEELKELSCQQSQ